MQNFLSESELKRWMPDLCRFQFVSRVLLAVSMRNIFYTPGCLQGLYDRKCAGWVINRWAKFIVTPGRIHILNRSVIETGALGISMGDVARRIRANLKKQLLVISPMSHCSKALAEGLPNCWQVLPKLTTWWSPYHVMKKLEVPPQPPSAAATTATATSRAYHSSYLSCCHSGFSCWGLLKRVLARFANLAGTW